MRLLRVFIVVVAVLISAQMARGHTPAQEKPANPDPSPRGQPPAMPGQAAQGRAPAKPSPAAGPAPARPGASPPTAPPAAPAAQAAPVPPPAATPDAAAPVPEPASAPKPQPTETYVYRAEARRDPFLSLVGTGVTPRDTSRKGEGPAGMTIGEVSVRGILQSRGALVAMIQGPDNKTYVVHQGDRLLDGTIKTITPQGLIVIQEVNDPLSLVRQREVRKLLRSLEDAKE
jgi:Tfp pilus assembly protein PilP